MSDKDLDTGAIDIYEESAEASVSRIAGTIIGLLFAVIITFYLSVEQVGLFFFYIMIVYMSSQVIKGVGLAVRKEVSSREFERSRVLYSGAVVALILYVILLLLILSLHDPINQYSEIDVTYQGLIITYFVFVTQSMNRYLLLYHSGCGYPGQSQKIKSYVGKLSMVAFSLLLLFIHSSVAVALVAYGLSNLLSSLVFFYITEREYASPDYSDIRTILAFSKWSIPNSLFNDFYQRFDTIILSIMVGSIAVGYYDSSVRISTLGFAFAIGVSSTSNVKISGLYESGRSVLQQIDISFNIINVVVLPTLIISVFHADTVLTVLYGSEYADASVYLILIIVYQVLQSYRLQFESIFNAIDMPKKITTASVTAVVVNIITAPFLVIWVGGAGAVLSTIISEVFRYALFQYKIHRQFGRFVYPKEKIYQLIFTAFIISIIYLRGIVIPTRYGILIDVSATIILYIYLVNVFCPNTREYLIAVKDELKSSVNR